ncbi:cell division septation protein DedD [Azospirillum agricola]|uniref:SPOR domain-containing protein n=1 Tax=Azospirillum agricola TaxID=1720247 RepID=UPI001AEA00E7|nr:SPOR domain-containing protein [Azospirillum agricola]MBP2227135.1 cell division septation protein DedD [Azospirillum agricola]
MKAADKPGNAPNPESEDIAKLLRALNEDLKADPIDVAELDEDDEDAQPSRGLPLGKIAAALLAAAGIGVAVVMLDPGGDAPPADTATAALAPPAPAITRAPPPTSPAQPAPESMIARAPAPAAALPSNAPPPPPAVAAPLTPPPALRVPEPPALPPTASATRPAATARAPEAPPPAPAPQAAAPAAEAVVPPPPAAPRAADPGELQAMLAPPKEPREARRAPTKPAEAKPVEAKPAEAKAAGSKLAGAAPPRPAGASPTPATPGGRYAVQIGTFKVAENAESLTRRLQGGGFPAYTLEWTDQSNQSWRAVRVGGYADAEAAKRAAGQLKAKMGVNSVVVTTR